MHKRLFLFVPLLGMLLGGCNGGINPVTGVSLDKTELTIMETKSEVLTASIEPKKATNHIIKWESSNEEIATVSTGGVVTGVSTGKADIKVITDDGGFTATCAVTVTDFIPEVTHVTNIALSKQLLTIEPGNSVTISYTVFPLDADVQDVTITSSDDEIVAISNVTSEEFTVTGGKEGKASVFVTSNDKPEEGKSHVVGSCAINVYKEDEPGTVHVTSIGLSSPSLSLVPSQDEEISWNVLPTNATNKDVDIVCSDETVATITYDKLTQKINVHPIAVGDCDVTVTAVDKPHGTVISSACHIDVHTPIAVTSVSLSPKSVTLNIDHEDTAELIATVYPENATNKEVSYYSDDPTIAVEENGKIVAKSIGTTKIHVVTSDGGFSDFCDVTVIHTPMKRVFIDFDCNDQHVEFKSHAYIYTYGYGETPSWPGTKLDTGNVIDKNSIVLSNRHALDRDFYYWDVSSDYTTAIFNNSDGTEVWNRWNAFNLSSYSLFQPIEWGVPGSDESTVGGYNSYNVYQIKLTKSDSSVTTEYNVPEWSSNGYSAPKASSGYMWTYENGTEYVNGTNLTSDIELFEVEIPEADKRTVTFYDAGVIYETVVVKVGSQASPSLGNPHKDQEGGKVFTFDKWVDSSTKEDRTAALANVQVNLTVESTYTSSYKSGRYITGNFTGTSVDWTVEGSTYMVHDSQYEATIELVEGNELKIVYYNGTEFQDGTWCGWDNVWSGCGAYSKFESKDGNIRCKESGTYNFYFTDNHYGESENLKISIEKKA